MLDYQKNKLNNLGLKLNDYTTIGKYNVDFATCMSSTKFCVAIYDTETKTRTQLCTRCNFDTAFLKVKEFLKNNQ